jgi:hypothetical protein
MQSYKYLLVAIDTMNLDYTIRSKGTIKEVTIEDGAGNFILYRFDREEFIELKVIRKLSMD